MIQVIATIVETELTFLEVEPQRAAAQAAKLRQAHLLGKVLCFSLRKNAANLNNTNFQGNGYALTLNANTELRMKTPGTTVNFPGVSGWLGLILNGGLLNDGDSGGFSSPPSNFQSLLHKKARRRHRNNASVIADPGENTARELKI